MPAGTQSHKPPAGSKGLLPKKERLQRGKQKDKERIAKLRSQLHTHVAATSSGTPNPSALIYLSAALRAGSDAAVASALRRNASPEQAEEIGEDVKQALLDLAPATPEDSSCSDSDSSAAHASSVNGLGSPGTEAMVSATTGVCPKETTCVFLPGSEAVASEADDLGFASENGTLGHGGTAVPFFDAKLDKGMPLPVTDSPPECYTIFDAIADEAVSGLPHEDMTASGPDTAAGCGHLPSFHLHKSPMVDVGVGSPLTTPDTSGSSISVQCNQFAAGRQGESSKDFNSHNLAQHRAADVHAHASPRAFDATSEVSPVDFKSQTLANTVERLAVDVVFGNGTPGPIKAPEPPGAQNGASLDSFNVSKNDNGKGTSYCECRSDDNEQSRCGPSATVHDILPCADGRELLREHTVGLFMSTHVAPGGEAVASPAPAYTLTPGGDGHASSVLSDANAEQQLAASLNDCKSQHFGTSVSTDKSVRKAHALTFSSEDGHASLSDVNAVAVGAADSSVAPGQSTHVAPAVLTSLPDAAGSLISDDAPSDAEARGEAVAHETTEPEAEISDETQVLTLPVGEAVASPAPDISDNDTRLDGPLTYSGAETALPPGVGDPNTDPQLREMMRKLQASVNAMCQHMR